MMCDAEWRKRDKGSSGTSPLLRGRTGSLTVHSLRARISATDAGRSGGAQKGRKRALGKQRLRRIAFRAVNCSGFPAAPNDVSCVMSAGGLRPAALDRGGRTGPSQGPVLDRVSAGGLLPVALDRGGRTGPSQGPV